MAKTFLIYHPDTGAYFGLDDGVLLIDADSLSSDEAYELGESGEMPDTVSGEDLVGLLPLRISDAIAVYPWEADVDDDNL